MNDYDVAIVGRHLATSLLAAILAKNGVRVALVSVPADAGEPAGETTVPYTADLFFLLGNRFGLPEITAMGMVDTLPESVRAACGEKRNLGFLYHREGRAQQPEEALQFNVPGEHAEWHLYRPAVEDYAARLAADSGAVLFDSGGPGSGDSVSGDAPVSVQVSPDGVRVDLADGTTVRAEYLVNGSADPAIGAGQLPPSFGARARQRGNLLYARMDGVVPFESVTPLDAYKKASPWSAGTLSHLFDGGWIQVAPYGDGRCGVAVGLDPDRWPDPDFGQLIKRFPGLSAQFAQARPVGEWESRTAWPAWAETCAGSRWLLFDRGAGRHDFLLSRDVTMSLELVHAAAAGLLRLAWTKDWAGDGMKEAAEFQAGLFAFNDRLLAAARIATRDFSLLNAYLRVWLLWTILADLSVKRARLDAEAVARDPLDAGWATVEKFDQVPYWYRVPAGLPELVAESLADIENVTNGASPSKAASRIFARLRRARFVPPLYAFGDPGARYYTFTRTRRVLMLLWTKTVAPSDFRRLLTADNVTGRADTGNFP
ncbi:MAG: hypothetical protein J2P26_03785, partial [Nocardiopsaceae bacterium]|nr:hypothetical protein [Nocardiopsaceae bacterium]